MRSPDGDAVANPLLHRSGHSECGERKSLRLEADSSPRADHKQSSFSMNFGIAVVGASVAILVIFLVIAAADKATQYGSTVQDPPVITTTSGPIQGKAYTSNSSIVMEAWMGIPYAEPPVGDNRWKAPIAKAAWTYTLDTKELKPMCVQWGGEEFTEMNGNEDCLYLNVYRQQSPSGTGPYPVLFYIYGGGLMSGQANNNFDALITSADDVSMIVVEVGYRLNAFGFMAIEELSAEQGGTSGNYGIRDQILALQWVRDNINLFNGDPDRVTLTGQSSGGTSIMALYSSPLASNLFAGGWSMSGSPNISMPLDIAHAQNAHFVNAGGSSASCGSAGSSADVMTCLRSLPAQDILNAVPTAWNMPGIWSLPKAQSGQGYQGLVIVDGTVITHDFPTALQLGIVDKPLIYGNMQAEPDEGPEMVISTYNTTGWRALLNTTFGGWRNPDGDYVSSRIFELYREVSEIDPQYAYDQIISDSGLFCGQLKIARQVLPLPVSGRQRSSPLYVYEDQWGLETPYVSPWAGNTVKYPFHDTLFFLTTGQWNMVGDSGTYEPTARDLQGAEEAMMIMRYFMAHGTLEGATTFDWQPVDKHASWGSSDNSLAYGNYTVFVMDPEGSASTLNHKLDVCSFFNEVGLDEEKFWWAN